MTHRLIGDYPALPDTHPDRRPLRYEIAGWLGGVLAVLVIGFLILAGSLEGLA